MTIAPRPRIQPIGLRDLMAPVDLDHFMADYWGRRVLYVPGPADKFADLMSKEALFRALDDVPDRRRLRIGGQNAQGTHYELSDLSPKQARTLYELGLTLHVESLQRAYPPLLDVLARLQADLGLFVPMHCAAFLSPPSKGYSVHYDAVTQWVVQLHGTKRWRYSEGVAVSHPRANWFPFDDANADGPWARAAKPDLDTFHEVELSPGDLLYMPPGAWHAAEAVEESLHLCLKFDAVGWMEGLVGQLQRRLLPKAEWRATPVPLPDPRTGELSPTFRAELEERLADLVAVAASLDVETLCREIAGAVRPVADAAEGVAS